MKKESQIITENKAGAAILACGIGCFMFGIMVILAESNPNFALKLQWLNPVGPLSGKVGIGILSWLVSWAVLLQILKGKKANGKKLFQIGLWLIVISFVMTFPPFFNLFK